MRCVLSALLLAAIAHAQGPRHKPATVWSKDEQAAIRAPAADGDHVVFLVEGEGLCCRSTRDGRLLWRAAGIKDPPAIHEGKVYAGGVRFDAKSGRRLSDERLGECAAAPAVTSASWLVAARSGRLHSFGKHRWSTDVGPVGHTPVLGDASVFVVNENGEIRCLLAENGRVVWQYQSDLEPVGAPFVLRKRLYVPLRGALLCLAGRTGRELARKEATSLCGTAVVRGKVLFFPTVHGDVVRVEAAFLRELGRVSVGTTEVSRLAAGGKLLYGACGKDLFAVDTATGERVWRYVGAQPFTAPVAAGGALYATAGRVLLCLK